MKSFKSLSPKEKLEYIGILAIYPFILLFEQMGKSVKFLNTRKRQITASVLTVCMLMTMIPVMSLTAFAETTGLDTSLFATKEQLMTFNTDDTDGTTGSAKVYFGSNNQKWWIAGTQSDDSLVLFAASSFSESVKFSASISDKTYDADWGCTYDTAPSDVYANHYGASDLRAKLKALETSYFTSAEQTLMKDTILYTNDTKNGSIYYTTDKLYAAYGDYDDDQYITVGANSANSLNGALRVDKSYWKSGANNPFWLRSPYVYVVHDALVADPGYSVLNYIVNYELVSVVPAFSLNLSSVLFGSAAEAASSEQIGVSLTADTFTLRMENTSSNATVAYNADGVVTTGANGKYLCVQTTDNKIYTKSITSDSQTFTLSDIGVASLTENDRVWVESTTDNVTYATLGTWGVKSIAGAFTITDGDEGTEYTYVNGVLTILDGAELTIANTDPNTATSDVIVVNNDASANITLAGVNIITSNQNQPGACPLDLKDAGECVITLQDGTTNILNASATTNYGPGIWTPNGKQLTIKGNGTLVATGGNSWPGIGRNGDAVLLIEGGNIVATGGSRASGIGGSWGFASGRITVNGGTITATGGEKGAGIGGGLWGEGQDIIISSATVKAVAGSGANAIGGGANKGATTPTDGNGNNVYLLTGSADGQATVTVDGKEYTAIGGNYYVYLPSGFHTITVGDTTTTYFIAADGVVFTDAEWYTSSHMVVFDGFEQKPTLEQLCEGLDVEFSANDYVITEYGNNTNVTSDSKPAYAKVKKVDGTETVLIYFSISPYKLSNATLLKTVAKYDKDGSVLSGLLAIESEDGVYVIPGSDLALRKVSAWTEAVMQGGGYPARCYYMNSSIIDKSASGTYTHTSGNRGNETKYFIVSASDNFVIDDSSVQQGYWDYGLSESNRNNKKNEIFNALSQVYFACPDNMSIIVGDYETVDSVSFKCESFTYPDNIGESSELTVTSSDGYTEVKKASCSLTSWTDDNGCKATYQVEIYFMPTGAYCIAVDTTAKLETTEWAKEYSVQFDMNTGWYKCSFEIEKVSQHDFTGDFDDYDKNGHWHICGRGCGAVSEKEQHSFTNYTYNNDATYFANGTETATCDVDGCLQKDNREANGTKWVDNIAPTGEIKIGTNRWNSFLNTITFGLFFKETQTATVEALDNETGVDKIEYYLASAKIDDFTGIEWAVYDGSFNISPEKKYVVYAKITDKSGNETIICTDGIVLFNDTEITTGEYEYTLTTKSNIVTNIKLGNNTVKEIDLCEPNGNAGDLIDFTINDDGYIVLDGEDVESVAKDFYAGDYTITITYNALGETYVAGDKIADTVLTLKVKRCQIKKPTADNTVFTYNGTEQTYPVDENAVCEVTNNKRTNAGEQNVTVALKDKNNYEWADGTTDNLTFKFTIGRKALTVTANDNTITYGDAPSNNGVAYSGFVNGESESVLGGTLAYDYSYAQHDDVGNNYTITPKGVTAANYEITFIPGKLTVNPLKIDFDWEVLSPEDLVYDGEDKIIGITIKNKVTSGQYDVWVFAEYHGDTKNVTDEGFYAQAFGVSGSKASNYYVDNTDKSPVYKITKADPTPSWPDNLVGNAGEKLSTVTLPEGFAWENGNEVISYNNETSYKMVYTPDDLTNYNVVDKQIKLNSLDVTFPTAEITLKDNKWTEFWNNVTFGLFFKDTQEISITANDTESGVKEIAFYLSAEELSADDVKALGADKWTVYTEKFSVEPDNKYVVYARITDNAGNITYLNSDGIVLDQTSPIIVGIEDGKDVYGNATFTVDEDNLDSVSLDGEPMTAEDGKYVITADNAEHKVVVTDKSGNKTEYTLTVYKTYTVTYMADGKEVSTETVGYGKDATLPEVPAKDGYTGKWNADGKNITADTTITAEYTKIADKDTQSPATGDTSNIWLWIAVMFVSGMGVVATTVYGKKRRTR